MKEVKLVKLVVKVNKVLKVHVGVQELLAHGVEAEKLV